MGVGVERIIVQPPAEQSIINRSIGGRVLRTPDERVRLNVNAMANDRICCADYRTWISCSDRSIDIYDNINSKNNNNNSDNNYLAILSQVCVFFSTGKHV